MITSLQTFSSGNVLAWHEASLKYAACREFAYIESSLALASCLCELSLCAFRAATIRWLWDYRKESLPARKISIHSFQRMAHVRAISAHGARQNTTVLRSHPQRDFPSRDALPLGPSAP